MYNNIQSALRIKTLCREKRVQLKYLCDDCGININFLSHMRNNRTPSIDVFVKIADYLGCSVDYLTCRTDNKDVNK